MADKAPPLFVETLEPDMKNRMEHHENIKAFADYILRGLNRGGDGVQRFYDSRSELVDYEILCPPLGFEDYFSRKVSDFQSALSQSEAGSSRASFYQMRLGQCMNALEVWRDCMRERAEGVFTVSPEMRKEYKHGALLTLMRVSPVHPLLTA